MKNILSSYNLKTITLVTLAIFPFISGCKKFVEVPEPTTSINSENVFMNDVTATAALTSLYSKMSSPGIRAAETLTSISFYTGLSSDELTLYSAITDVDQIAYYKNNLKNTSNPNFWVSTYPTIYAINSAIEGLQKSTHLTPAVRRQLLGEAKFMRAFNYFYLANLYGNVALALTTDFTINERLARSPQSKVYEQIISDLKDACDLLSSDYLNGDALTKTDERLRPTKWAAIALLARAYLYTSDFVNAENTASQVINNKILYDTVPLNEVFLKNSKEAIWQLQPVNKGWNTEDARTYTIPETGPTNEWPVYLSNNLTKAFEPGDKRKNNWVNTRVINGIGYDYSYKYKSATFNEPVTEYSTVLRLGELFLVRSEARIELGKTTDALSDLNIIRNRAGLPDYSGPLDRSSLVNAIVHERQVELFTEWGHRWFDLKRTGKVNNIMQYVTAQKGGTWEIHWQWYPLSLTDLQNGPNLVQNEDY
ncbi:RagB/SusD family nutrient uptake outer membrane protein [Chitinophaga filiformis]|uniref:RagB/SusD family nutrient uptake outer membrane protein n=1 Tax=Chitinophaga filiformis TaxID=104663 RepID=UPI001F1DDE94|nr:RagB/SusD family nutrient uptake outer membrane protein [Chitinophaga filiformis]MCF6407522.1 RagB/SusD family nutrient uptake outer membrane protein [Chitinophaga filiformis]